MHIFVSPRGIKRQLNCGEGIFQNDTFNLLPSVVKVSREVVQNSQLPDSRNLFSMFVIAVKYRSKSSKTNDCMDYYSKICILTIVFLYKIRHKSSITFTHI